MALSPMLRAAVEPDQFDLAGCVIITAEGAPALAVVDVIDEGERIAHVLAPDSVLPEPGSRVLGHVDWARRFDHMQQHTGQHLLSAVFQELLEKFPDYVPTYLMAGGTLVSLGRRDEAAAVYRRGLEAAGKKRDDHAARELETALAELQPT